MAELNGLLSEYWHIILLAAFLFILAIDFILRFVWQSAKLNRELRQALTALRELRAKTKGAAKVKPVISREIKTAKKVAAPAKYKDKETGKTWTGHGKRPG